MRLASDDIYLNTDAIKSLHLTPSFGVNLQFVQSLLLDVGDLPSPMIDFFVHFPNLRSLVVNITKRVTVPLRRYVQEHDSDDVEKQDLDLDDDIDVVLVNDELFDALLHKCSKLETLIIQTDAKGNWKLRPDPEVDQPIPKKWLKKLGCMPMLHTLVLKGLLLNEGGVEMMCSEFSHLIHLDLSDCVYQLCANDKVKVNRYDVTSQRTLFSPSLRVLCLPRNEHNSQFLWRFFPIHNGASNVEYLDVADNLDWHLDISKVMMNSSTAIDIDEHVWIGTLMDNDRQPVLPNLRYLGRTNYYNTLNIDAKLDFEEVDTDQLANVLDVYQRQLHVLNINVRDECVLYNVLSCSNLKVLSLSIVWNEDCEFDGSRLLQLHTLVLRNRISCDRLIEWLKFRLYGLVELSSLHFLSSLQSLLCLQLEEVPEQMWGCFESLTILEPDQLIPRLFGTLFSSGVNQSIERHLKLNERVFSSEEMWQQEKHKRLCDHLVYSDVFRHGRAGRDAFFMLADQYAGSQV